LYGAAIAALEANEKSFVSDLMPKEMQATAQGIHQTITGLTLLPASLIAGFLWTQSNNLPFYFSFITSMIAITIILVLLKYKK